MHRILIVEDDDNARRGLKELLTSEGYFVAAVEDGVAARAQLQKQHFDILLCDYCLPGENGVELCSRFLRTHPDMAFYLITAYSNPEISREALACGVRRVFKKPIILDALFDELEAVARRIQTHTRQKETTHQGQYINC